LLYISVMPVQTAETITDGAESLARGDFASAERVANALLARGQDPDALHLLALARIQQNRREEAVTLLNRSLAVRPRHPHALFNLGRVLALLKRDGEAVTPLSEAVLVQPDMAEAWYELGETQNRLGDFTKAEASLRQVLALEPGHPLAKLSLGVALKDAGRAAEAESLLAEGLDEADNPRLKAGFAYNLALAQYDQGKKEAALENFTLVRRLDPARSSVEISRTGLLEELSRFEEAEKLLEELLKREPLNNDAHIAYNDLMYRLRRDEDFLSSYDRAPPATALQMSKAGFLLKTKKLTQAHELYAGLLRHEPGDVNAAIGAASALNLMGRHAEAMLILEQTRARQPGSAMLHHHLAVTALQARDPQKGAALAEQSLRLAPLDHYGLAMLGSAWRMMGDDRDEMLNGYDELIGVFDLEPPPGFSSMAAFNEALNATLDRMHTTTREPIEQSLRGGSQTRGNIFREGHDLVDRLKLRIAEAMTLYIAAIKPDAKHPFRGQRTGDFRFTGSWSSRLGDCGFHINHVHPEGWISSCYYVGVPDAVKDETARQGWIKFGEPGVEMGLGPRRVLQPVPGRLVLFPSYMWHGTIPFQGASPRTTIAFDAVPR
jgi:tetratricopeptide (TPR) repeat protein